MTGVPLNLGEAEAETSNPSTTSTPVVSTPSLAEGLPAMRMIPTPGSRVQSSETSGARTQTTTPTQTTTRTTTKDNEPPPPEPDPMPWPSVDNPLPEGEEEDVALEEELARQAGRVYLRWDSVGIRYARARPRSAGSLRITIGGLCPSSAWHRITWSGFGFFPVTAGYEYRIYESWRMRASKRLREIIHGIRNKGGFQEVEAGQQEEPGILDGWIPSHRGSTTYEATREKMALELGRTRTQSEVFARTHTRKEDREWVDKRSSDVNDAYEAELKRLQDERQAAIDAGGPVPPTPPPIDEAEVWARVAGGRKRGRVYGMGVVPSHKYPP
ncbi:hypothetical protein PIB30_101284, partial [Stylosanthes scabra]|nr:hypothetical protein [Stylosanthes scabra]